MKPMVCGSALIIALLSASPVLAADSAYLEERMKRHSEKVATSTVMPSVPSPRATPGTTATPATEKTLEPVGMPDPWWR
ncbi:hypothetical protein EQG41_18935 [Billgrantia azerbaijanica]|nr:hypothetical protein EQG41_18935 [Halomonas azerbaijanica]